MIPDETDEFIMIPDKYRRHNPVFDTECARATIARVRVKTCAPVGRLCALVNKLHHAALTRICYHDVRIYLIQGLRVVPHRIGLDENRLRVSIRKIILNERNEFVIHEFTQLTQRVFAMKTDDRSEPPTARVTTFVFDFGFGTLENMHTSKIECSHCKQKSLIKSSSHLVNIHFLSMIAAMSSEKLNRALEETVLRYPYNSASALIETFTHTFNEQMGGSCAQQLRIAKSMLKQRGMKTQFLSADTSVHTMGIVTDGKNRYIIDPSKTMTEAIPVDRLLKEGETLISPAFPNNTRAKRSVRFVPTGEYTFRQEVITVSERTHWQESVSVESFDIRKVVDNPPMGNIDCEVSRNSKSIQMVAVLPDKDVAALKATDTSRMQIRLLGGEEEHDPDRKKMIFGAIAQSCRVTRNDLFRYLFQGQELLQQLMKNHQTS